MKILDIFLPYQKKFFTNPTKRKIWVSSRQIGKSFCVAGILTFKALQKHNGLAICISVNSRSASEIISKCKQFAESVKVLSNNAITYTASFDTIRFSNGSRIMSLPSTADSLRGWSAQCVVVDEASFVWKLDDILQGLAPTLTRDPDAELILTTTPAGKNGPFYELYNNALNDPQWYVQHTTIHDAIADGLKVDLNSLHSLCPDPDVFAQEYECTFLSEYSSMIDLNLIDYYDELPKEMFTNYIGIDVGSTSDRTAMVTVKQAKDIAYIDDIVIMHKASYEDQLDMAKSLHNKNTYKSGYVDKTGIGSAFSEFVEKKVCSQIKGLQFTVANKVPMFENLRSRIFDHTLKINRKFKSMIELDFNNVRRIVNEAGQVKYEAGHNSQGHSDITSAIVLALQAIKDKPVSFSLPSAYQRYSAFGGVTSMFR